jgi:hypothetical protein
MSKAATADIDEIDLESGQKLFADAYEHIFHTYDGVEHFNIVALQRMNLHCLRQQIMDETVKIFEGKAMGLENSKSITPLMHDYCERPPSSCTTITSNDILR